MICGTCGELVKFGWRHGNPGWLHREDKDHPGFPVVEPETEVGEPIPEPEVRNEPVTPKDSRVPGGVRTITNLLARQDWELRRLSYARGPYIGAKGNILSISDSIVLGAMGPETLDKKRHWAVGSWRDGKFDFAYVGAGSQLLARVNATELKEWVKGSYEPPAPDSND